MFRLPAQFDVPNESGSPLWNVFPSYSPDGGLSEWGMGWQSNLSITRWRAIGEVDYSNADEFLGPWGPMRAGAAGEWIPRDPSPLVRIVGPTATPPALPCAASIPAGKAFYAFMPDGRVAIFGEEVPNYSWWIRVVYDPVCRATTMEYVKKLGRVLVSKVRYGGSSAQNLHYTIVVNYEDPPAPFDQTLVTSFRGGFASTLSSRVRSLDMYAFSRRRWSYVLHHERDQLVSQLVYLTSVQKLFSSGERLPPVTYAYDRDSSDLRSAAPAALDEVTNLAAALGLTAAELFPKSKLDGVGARYFDELNDGLTDFVLEGAAAYRASTRLEFYARDFSRPQFPFELRRTIDLPAAVYPVGLTTIGRMNYEQGAGSHWITQQFNALSSRSTEFVVRTAPDGAIDSRITWDNRILGPELFFCNGAPSTADIFSEPRFVDLNNDRLPDIVNTHLQTVTDELDGCKTRTIFERLEARL
ncbi:MAG: hypothetical protein IT381_24730, partial [Deltaproteobacteria bacterium]|nr:hypothetical protein [Deltaproteobacteria bacterium]